MNTNTAASLTINVMYVKNSKKYCRISGEPCEIFITDKEGIEERLICYWHWIGLGLFSMENGIKLEMLKCGNK